MLTNYFEYFFIFILFRLTVACRPPAYQAKKIKPMYNGCGCKRAHQNVANAVIGSNWLKRLPFKSINLINC